MKTGLGILAAILCFSQLALAGRERIAAHMLKGIIDINASYHGERLFLYGVSPENCDVVVSVTMQGDTLGMGQKGKFGPLWLTVGKITFINWPVMYKIKSTRPLIEILPKDTAMVHLLGYDAVKAQTKVLGTDEPGFYLDQLASLSESQRLFSDWEEAIQMHAGGLYDASFFWPARAKTGDYLVQIFVIRNSQIIGHVSEVVNVQKIGIEQWLSNESQRHGVIFGSISVLMAILSGGLVSMISRGIIYFLSMRKSIMA